METFSNTTIALISGCAIGYFAEKTSDFFTFGSITNAISVDSEKSAKLEAILHILTESFLVAVGLHIVDSAFPTFTSDSAAFIIVTLAMAGTMPKFKSRVSNLVDAFSGLLLPTKEASSAN